MISYIIKTILCSGILLLIYFLLLEKEKMHHFNRFYLLFAIAFSFVIPLIVIEQQHEVLPVSEIAYAVINADQPVQINSKPAATVIQKHLTLNDVLLFVYLMVTTFLLSRFTRNLTVLFLKIKREKKVRLHDVVLVLRNNSPVPYSFLNYIFVDREAFEKSSIEKEILYHELAHARQKHSWDILFNELLLCLCWFNPFLPGYKKAIRLNHEFLADAEVINHFHDANSYQHLLLNKICTASHSLLTSSFNYLTTKKRLIMMMKTTSPMVVVSKQIALLPVIASLIFMFSSGTVAQSVEAPAKRDTMKIGTNGKKDTTQPKIWLGMSIGHTKEGASEQLVREYKSIINKYKNSDSLDLKDFQNVNEKDRERMETIFKQMNLEQQASQEIGFFKRPAPLPKVVPTKQQFESFKNPSVYGVWINNKRVLSEELNNYENTDFSQVFVSKLYGAAKKGRNYSYQVNMMTNDYYREYYNKKISASSKSFMMVIHRTGKGVGLKAID